MTARRRRIGKLALGGLGVVVAIVALVVAARTPSLDRAWDEDVRVLSGVVANPDGSVELTEIRDWGYTRDSVVAKEWFAQRYDPADVQSIWLYEQELGLGGWIAHTFLIFEFPEAYGRGRWVGLSVETRREVGERYSIVGGMLRKFEVTHMWATEEDLVRRRVEHLDYPLTRYRIVVPDEYRAPIFRQLVDETAALATTPRWYNTVTTNCTNALISYVNELRPDAIPRHHSYVFTGRVDGYLSELGYLDGASAESITRTWLAENPLR